MLGRVLKLLLVGVLAVSSLSSVYAKERVQPFILASTDASDFSAKLTEVKEKLQAAGFELVGSYAPYPDVQIIVITNDALKTAATKSERGGYGAVMRVSVTKSADNTEVAYTNPTYWSNAYRMSDSLDSVKESLKNALGAQNEFGAGDKELSAEDLRKYHYTFMMEYFDDPSKLNKYDDHQQAVSAVEKNLAAGAGAAAKVYRVDLGKDPQGKEMTLFGVALKGRDEKDCSGDNYIMSRIDKTEPRQTAHLPYELLVYGNKVEALYARFRIAISWPHLPMMASETGATFMSIMCAPGAIEDALEAVAGGEKKSDKSEGDNS
jgi:hypothetical protein